MRIGNNEVVEKSDFDKRRDRKTKTIALSGVDCDVGQALENVVFQWRVRFVFVSLFDNRIDLFHWI